MRDFAGNMYRNFPAAMVTKAGGGEISCRGLVLRPSGGDSSGEYHGTGMLPSPKWTFTGSMEELAAPGDILEQDGSSWRVLECRELKIGSTAVCVRALLEELGEEADDEGAG